MDGSQQGMPDKGELQQLLLPMEPLLPLSTDLHAAVLLCWVASAEPYFLLTQRSNKLSQHAGQISLPGGRVEAADPSLEMTALREAHEEIGLDPALLQLLGRLPDVQVSSGIAITPVVAWCAQEPELQPNTHEVDFIISLPVRMALKPSNYGIDAFERNGVRREFHFLCYREHYIWGATARILLSLAGLLQQQG
jgi:8-oxo-dGTP pyrophosphatase MutT (NUDIX family)